MRILITNDDGINAPGLKVAEAIAREVAGPDGEIWVVAPAFEQSGVAHCISYSRPMMVAELGPHRFAAEGSPADCVLAALGEILPGRPDLILSGVNRGNNAADNALYSGTLGAAMEGALQNLPAIALSQYLGPKTMDLENPFEASAAYGAQVVKRLLDAAIWQETADYRLLYNVNFPPVPAAQVKGIKAARQGWRPDSFFGTEPTTSPSGRRFVWIRGGGQHQKTAEGTDAAVNLDGYVAVTPMRLDLTAHDALDAVEQVFA